MKRSFILTILWLWAGVLLSMTAACAAGIKIGVIDTQRIMRESKAAKEARALLLEDLKEKRAVLQAKQAEVRAVEEELKREEKEMPPSLRRVKREELAREIKELRRLRSDLEEEWKKKERELTHEILKGIKEVTEAFLRKESYTIILENKSVVAADKGSTDITDKIIHLYDIQKR